MFFSDILLGEGMESCLKLICVFLAVTVWKSTTTTGCQASSAFVSLVTQIHEPTAYLLIMTSIYLNKMVILSNGYKPDNFRSHSSLKTWLYQYFRSLFKFCWMWSFPWIKPSWNSFSVLLVFPPLITFVSMHDFWCYFM